MKNYLAIFVPIILLDYASYFVLYAFSVTVLYCYIAGKLVGLISFYFLGTHGNTRARLNQFFMFAVLFIFNILTVYGLNNYVEQFNNVLVYKIVFDIILFVFNYYMVKILGFKSRLKT